MRISGSSILVSNARKQHRARRGAHLHSRTHAHACLACITQVVNYVTMRHPLVWRGAPYRRHRGTLRFAVGFGWFQLPVRSRPLPRAGPASGCWHGCCSAGGSPRYAAGACATPWSPSRCTVAVSLHLPGEWLPAGIGVGMSTPDAFSAHQPSWSCCRTCNPEQESVPLPDEQRSPSGTIGCVAGRCPAWIDFGGWRGS